MSDITKKVLVLGFKCADGSKRSLTINKPAEGLTGATIKAQMDAMITQGVIANAETGSPITGRDSAKYVTQAEDQITL